jgi:RND family efflux transporter MFP subunit
MSSQTVENTNAIPETKSKHKVPWYQTARARNVGLALAAISIIGLISWWFFIHPYVSTDDARVAMTMIRVAPSGVSGRIEKVNVTEGSLVKKGDVLVELDHRISQANFDKAKAKSILAQREFERMQRLGQEGSTTQQSVDVARANAASAEAELKLAEVALENTSLKSPFDGVVIQKLADVGNLLEAGQTAVVVADENNAWIAANIEETSVAEVKKGQSVRISVDEGGELEGTVSEVRAASASQFALIPGDTGAGNYTKVVQRIPIKVELKNHGSHPLRAGQSVELKVRVR